MWATAGLEVENASPLLCARVEHAVSCLCGHTKWGVGAGSGAYPGSAGLCTRHPRGRVVAGPGSGPPAAQTPADTVSRRPRSLRGTHSAMCPGAKRPRCALDRLPLLPGPCPECWALPTHWARVETVGVLTAAPAVAACTGVVGPAVIAITVIARRADTGERYPLHPAAGMLAAVDPFPALRWGPRRSSWTR